MDRVPIEDVIDKEPDPRQSQDSGDRVHLNSGINEMRDMVDLSTMMGFDGTDFSGETSKAIDIYNWAKAMSGKDAGPEVIGTIKEAIKKLGIPSQGKDLITRLHRWTQLDSSINQLKDRQKLISNV